MPDAPKLGFVPFDVPAKNGGVLVVFCDDKLAFGSATKNILAPAGDLVTRAAWAETFTGKSGTALDLVLPPGLKAQRLVVIGAGKAGAMEPKDFVKLGGIARGKVPKSATQVTIVADLPGGAMTPEQAADIALGANLRGYTFERYKTKRKEGEVASTNPKISVAVGDVAAARKLGMMRDAVGEGVLMARDLVNEPANILFPEEFARRASALKSRGVAIEILDEKAMAKLGMHSLLAVGLGSERESRVVVMRWDGGKKGTAPVCFVGKGVCFDTGGISIKPAQGMEDMKGDMAGAACVVGLMSALATRKAKVNAIGIIGCVENMPDGKAMRPGDIVTSMSGQTIEIINTDAEGRLVLADVLWYAAKRFKPKFMVDLATLTGAILVALGHEHVGLFSNDDKLSDQITRSGLATGELVWRMPLMPEYDKIMDSKFADVKNAGGRMAGSITAAQFLQRFVDGTTWAHLDIAGAGFDSRQTDINKSWASGWGVRLLDRLVSEFYES